MPASRSRSLATAAGVVAGLVLMTCPAAASFPGANGKVVVWGDDGIETSDPDGTNRVTVVPGGTQPSAAGDGFHLAYTNADATELWVTDLDGNQPVQAIAASDGYQINGVAMSPDGTQVAFGAVQADPVHPWCDVVLVIPSAGGSPAAVTSSAGNRCPNVANGLSWSPDGSAIAYTSYSLGSAHIDLTTVNVTSGVQQVLTANAPGSFFTVSGPAWSPDGSTIAFREQQSSDIWVVGADGTGVTDLTNTTGVDDMSPAWAPDGTAIAYVPAHDPQNQVWSMKPDGEDSHLLFTVPSTSTIYGLDWAPAQPPSDVTISNCSDPLLASLTAVVGTLTINVSDNCDLDVSELTTVGGDIVVAGASQSPSISFPALASIGGGLSVSCAATLADLFMPALEVIGGDIVITGTSLSTLSLPSLTDVTDLDVTNNAELVHITAPTLTNAADLDVTSNADLVHISAPTLTDAGRISIGDNATVTGVDLSSLTTVTDLHVTDDASLTEVQAPILSTVAGDLVVTADPVLVHLSIPQLQSVAGNMTVTGHTTFTSADSCTGATSSESIDGAAPALDTPSLTSVDGDLTLDSEAASLDLGDVTVGGDLALTTDGTTTMAAQTPGGSTALSMTNGTATMEAHLEDGTFPSPVQFAVTAVDPTTLAPEAGTDAAGDTAEIDPVVAYQFAFDVPLLGVPATLDFTVDLTQLDAAPRAAVVEALDSGTLALVVKGDAAGDTFTAYPLCGADQTTGDGCATVSLVDADGNTTTSASGAATVRFEGLTGHFSTFGLATVTPSVGSGGSAPISLVAPTDTTVPEGSPASAGGAFSDADGNDTLSITKSSGAGTVVDGHDGTWTWSNTLSDDGSGTVEVQASDGTHSEATQSFAWHATNVAPSAVTAAFTQTAGRCPAAPATTNATLTGSWTDPGADTWRVDIDWDYTGTFTADSTISNLTTRSFSASTSFTGGTHTAAVRVTDDDNGRSNVSIATNTFTVGYTMSGLLAPFNADGSSVWKYGSTIPVKVRITDCSGAPVANLNPTVGTSLVSTSDPSDAIDEATATGTADAGNTMRYDAATGQYVYNFATKSLTDPAASYYMYVRFGSAVGQTPSGTPSTSQSWQRFGLRKK